jgi:hypothetical protein
MFVGWTFRAEIEMEEWPAIRANVQASQPASPKSGEKRVPQSIEHEGADSTEPQSPLFSLQSRKGSRASVGVFQHAEFRYQMHSELLNPSNLLLAEVW